MKKKLFNLFIVLASFLVLNPSVSADSISVGNATVTQGNSATLSVKVSSSDRISGGTFYLSTSSDYLTITSVSPVSGFSNMGSKTSLAIVPQVGSNSTIASGSTLFTVKVKVASNAPAGSELYLHVKNATITVGETSKYPSDGSGKITVKQKQVVNNPTNNEEKEEENKEEEEKAKLLDEAKRAVEKAENMLSKENIDAAYALVNQLESSIDKENLLGRLKLCDYKLEVEANRIICEECSDSNCNIWIYITIGLIALLIFESVFIIVKSKNY